MQITLTKEAEESIKQSKGLIEIYKNYKITNPSQHSMAVENLIAIKERIKKLDETRKSITKPIDDAKSRVMDMFRKPLECLETIKKTVNDEIVRFERIQEQERLKQQQKLIDEAKAKEAKEKAKLEEKAKLAEQKGNADKAETLRQQAQETSIQPMIISTQTERQGLGKRKIWKFKISNENLIPREYLAVDEVAIGKVVRALQEKTKIPGVEVYFEEVLA